MRPHLQDPRWSKPKGQGVEGTLITRIYASCHFWEQQFLDQLLVLYPGGENSLGIEQGFESEVIKKAQ